MTRKAAYSRIALALSFCLWAGGLSAAPPPPKIGDPAPAFLRLGLAPGVRFYVRGAAMDGMWFGPRLELTHAWEDARREWNVGGAVLSGYSLRLSEGFTVQGALGLGATYQPARAFPPAWTVTVGYRAQLSLGWSF